MSFSSLILHAFVAGFLVFLVPCTLPFIPAFLTFISGVSPDGIKKNAKISMDVRRKIIWNALWYVLGFTVIFLILGTIFSGVEGIALAKYRLLLEKISGVLILAFGIYITHLFDLPFLRFLDVERKFKFVQKMTPGKPLSSFLFGLTSAFAWTPCIGPILGAILLLSSSSTTVFQGAFLQLIFALGLAIPFLLVAIGIGQAVPVIKRLQKYTRVISIIGGGYIALIGLMLLTGTTKIGFAYFFRFLYFFGFEKIQTFYNYL